MTNNSASELCFKLFTDAIKQKDPMQFCYYSLYSAIQNSSNNDLINEEENQLVL